MRTLLGLISKRGPLAPDLLGRVPRVAADTLSFRHMAYRSAEWRSLSGSVAIFAWDNEEVTGRRLLHVRENGRAVTALAGYIAHPSVQDGRDVAAIESLAMDDHTAARLGGAFVLLTADGETDTVTVRNAVTRLEPFYWAETGELILFGTRALLLSCLLSGTGQPDYDPSALVPFIINGYFQNDATPYRGVQAIGGNSRLTASPHGVAIAPLDDFDRECGTVIPNDRDYDDLAGLLVRGVSGLKGQEVVCEITGGKDSRLVAAALHAAGISFKMQTRGFPGHPDVVVGRRIAGLLGVVHRNKAPRTVDEGREVFRIDLLARARRNLFGADGMLTAYLNVDGAATFSPSPIVIGGRGGESLRGGFAKEVAKHATVTWESAEEFVTKRLRQAQRIFVPNVTRPFGRFLSDWLANERQIGMRPAVALDRFYLAYRTGRWAAASRACQYGSYGMQPLFDNQVTKHGLRATEDVKLNDELSYNLLRRLAPALVDVPFNGDRWLFEIHGPRPGEEEAWLARAPIAIEAGTRDAFDWRFTCATDLYEATVGQVLDDRRAEALFDIVDRVAVKNWFEQLRGKAPLSTPRAQLWWGLYTASVLLSNEWLRRDGPVREVIVRVPPSSGAVSSPPPSEPT